jgi:hypothetical protein
MNQTKPAGGGITMIESSGVLEYSIRCLTVNKTIRG